MCTLIPKKYAIMNTLPTNVLHDIYCPKSNGSVIKEAQKKGGENSPISPPLDPRLQFETFVDMAYFYLLLTIRSSHTLSNTHRGYVLPVRLAG